MSLFFVLARRKLVSVMQGFAFYAWQFSRRFTYVDHHRPRVLVTRRQDNRHDSERPLCGVDLRFTMANLADKPADRCVPKIGF